MEAKKDGKIYDLARLSPQEIWASLLDEREDMAELRDEMNKDFKERLILLSDYKRQFLLGLLTVTGIIVGLSPFNPSSLTNPMYKWGLVLQIVTVVLILLYNREGIDLEWFGMRKLQDKYNEIAEAKLGLIKKYIDESKFKPEDFLAFKGELHTLPAIVQLKKDNENLTKARKDRGSEMLDFFAEFSIFLFVFSAFLIVFGLLNLSIVWWQLLILALVLIYVTFGDSLAYAARPVNLLATKMKRRGLLLDGSKLKQK